MELATPLGCGVVSTPQENGGMEMSGNKSHLYTAYCAGRLVAWTNCPLSDRLGLVKSSCRTGQRTVLQLAVRRKLWRVEIATCAPAYRSALKEWSTWWTTCGADCSKDNQNHAADRPSVLFSAAVAGQARQIV